MAQQVNVNDWFTHIQDDGEPPQPTQAQPIVDTSVAEAEEEIAMQAWEPEGGRAW